MTKNSKVLALKYRPQSFNDLIGQNIISDTISSDLLFIGVGSSIMPLATKYS